MSTKSMFKAIPASERPIVKRLIASTNRVSGAWAAFWAGRNWNGKRSIRLRTAETEDGKAVIIIGNLFATPVTAYEAGVNALASVRNSGHAAALLSLFAHASGIKIPPAIERESAAYTEFKAAERDTAREHNTKLLTDCFYRAAAIQSFHAKAAEKAAKAAKAAEKAKAADDSATRAAGVEWAAMEDNRLRDNTKAAPTTATLADCA